MAAQLDWDRWIWAGGMAAAAAALGVTAGLEPRFAIAAALGSAFVLIAFADLAAGLAVFAFIGFIELVPITGAALSFIKFAGLLLALSWFAVLTTRRHAELDFFTVHPLVSAALGLFAGWALLSMTWAEDPGAALGSVGRYGLNLVLFLIVFTAVRSARDTGRVLIGFILGAAVATAVGIVAPTGEESAERLGSDLLDPNELAAVLVSGTALAVGVAILYRGSPPVRLLGIGIAVFCASGILFTASRGGLVALAVALVVAVVIAGRWRPQVALVAIVLASASYIYFAALAPPETQERIAEPTQGQARQEEGRTTIWQVGWRAFEANPVQGVGSGNFEISSKHYLLEPGALARTDQIINEPKVAHNSYLEVASELGTVGFALLSLILGFSAGSLLLAARAFGRAGDRRMQAVSLCIAVALLGNLAAAFFVSGQYSKQLWLLLGLGPALLSISKAAEARLQSFDGV